MKKKDVTEEEEFSAGEEEHGEEANSGDDWTPAVCIFIVYLLFLLLLFLTLTSMVLFDIKLSSVLS